MRGGKPVRDGGVLLGLVLFLALLTAISWRKWGNPELDPGADLTVADLIAHDGYLAYEDVRYFYGPAGIYAMAGAFKLFGSSFTVAFVFGYAQTIAILAAFYAVARNWLTALTAGLATAVLAAIGFSGTLFNFVLPHTSSATFGLLFVLLELLFVIKNRPLLAGIAAGGAALTRPEFAAVAAAVAAGAVIGEARARGFKVAARQAAAIAGPALLVAGAVLGAFAAAVGADRLFFENLIPLDFTRVAGLRFQENWAPFSIESAVATLARAALWVLPVGALAMSAVRLRKPGSRRVSALLPPLVALAVLVAVDGLARVSGAFPGTRSVVESEAMRLLLPMSWLPAAALAGAAWGAYCLLRASKPPLSGSWAADTALLAGALALALRAYNEFTTDIYATYYAALPLLVAAIGHEKLALRWPAARPVALGALAVAAALLVTHAYVGLYRDNNTPVRTARGSYVANDDAAPAIQGAVDLLRSSTGPGDTVLVLPDDPGLHFMADRRPALYETTFLPGTLDSEADDREAIERLERQRTPVVVVGARRFDQYGLPEIGVDFNRLLLRYVRRAYGPLRTFGDVENPPRGSAPSEAFEVFERRAVP